jgi:hypothetical protein
MQADSSAPESDRPDMTMLFLRFVEIGTALPLGIFSLFFINGEVMRANASATTEQRWLAVAVVTGAYLLIATAATRDMRAASLVAIVFCVVSTPIFALLLLFSGWSTQDWEASHPLVYYIGGNVILIHAAIWALLRALRERKGLATK